MRLEHAPGDKLFVDYAGLTMSIVDRGSGEVQSGADLRRRARREQLHLRRGEPDPDGRRLARRSRPCARVLRRRDAGDRAGQPEERRRPRLSLRARAQPELPGLRRALRRGDPAGPGAQAARQGQGRGRRAGHRALDPGAASPLHVLLPRRAQRRVVGRARTLQRPAALARRGLPAQPLPRARPAGAQAVAGRALRVRRPGRRPRCTSTTTSRSSAGTTPCRTG